MKTLFRYRLIDNMKSLAAMAVVLLLVFGGFWFTFTSDDNGHMTLSSMSCAIWALVIGIVVFRGDLRLGNQMGVCHRSAFLSSILANVISYAIGAAAMTLITLVMQLLTNGRGRLEIREIYQVLYSTSDTYIMPAAGYMRMMILEFALLLCLGFFGTLCSIAFWRVNRLGKWALSIGMAAAGCIGLPYLLTHEISWVIQLVYLLAENVWALVAFFLVWAVIFFLATWLLTRRAPILAASK